MRGFASVLFDESHRESWSIRPETAKAMNPGHPADAGYLTAAALLRHAGHEIDPHTEGPLTAEALGRHDVLVIAHPADDRWERTTKLGSPVFEAAELDAIETFVRAGGGLIVMTECEQDKYGTNVTELLSRFGIGVENVTIQDASNCFKGVAHWVLAEPQALTGGEALLAGVESACFYRSGALTAPVGGQVLLRSSATADPAGAPLAVAVKAEKGRVAVFADSDLFGDDSINDHHQAILWTNIVTWAAGAPAAQVTMLVQRIA